MENLVEYVSHATAVFSGARELGETYAKEYVVRELAVGSFWAAIGATLSIFVVLILARCWVDVIKDRRYNPVEDTFIMLILALAFTAPPLALMLFNAERVIKAKTAPTVVVVDHVVTEVLGK